MGPRIIFSFGPFLEAFCGILFSFSRRLKQIQLLDSPKSEALDQWSWQVGPGFINKVGFV